MIRRCWACCLLLLALALALAGAAQANPWVRNLDPGESLEVIQLDPTQALRVEMAATDARGTFLTLILTFRNERGRVERASLQKQLKAKQTETLSFGPPGHGPVKLSVRCEEGGALVVAGQP